MEKVVCSIIVGLMSITSFSKSNAKTLGIIDDFGPGVLGLLVRHVPNAAKIVGDCERTGDKIVDCTYVVGKIHHS